MSRRVLPLPSTSCDNRGCSVTCNPPLHPRILISHLSQRDWKGETRKLQGKTKMAFVISKKDAKGNVWSNSYWRPERVNYNKTEGKASVLFIGYRDNTKIDFIGSHAYNITDATIASNLFGSGATQEPLVAAYSLASSIKDVKNPSALTDPTQNTGFFDGAQEG